jgi:hypothetical protein
LSFFDRRRKEVGSYVVVMGQVKMGDHLVPFPVSKFNNDILGHRSTSTPELAKVINWNEHLTIPQKESLIEVMEKYRSSFTSRPGGCNLLQYEFKLTDDRPVMRYSRAVSFAVRPIIREQVLQMIDDNVFEVSHSPYINPITTV